MIKKILGILAETITLFTPIIVTASACTTIHNETPVPKSLKTQL